jgi:hypothetical protein
MTLPAKTDAQIREIGKQYGWFKWQVIEKAVEREYEALLVVRNLIVNAGGRKGAKKAGRARRSD